MDFFRRKIRRDAPLTTAPDTDHTWGADIETQLSDRTRRRSYFSVRRRDSTMQSAVSPVTIVKLTGGGDDDATGKGVDGSTLPEPKNATKAGRTLRRRSIPGLAYLVSMRSSLQSGNKSSAVEVAAPEAAEHRGAAVQRTASGSRWDRSGKRISGSSDESSGADSDDTLTIRDTRELAAVHSGLATASTAEAIAVDAEEQSEGPTQQTGDSSGAHTGGPGSPSSDAKDDCVSVAACMSDDGCCSTALYISDTVQEPPQCLQQEGGHVAGLEADAEAGEHRSRSLPISQKTTAEAPQSTAVEPVLDRLCQAALATADESHERQLTRTEVATTLLRSPRRRQQLTLGRWRGDAKASNGAQQQVLMPATHSTLLGLTVGRHNLWKSTSATKESPRRTLKDRRSLSGPRRVQSLLAGLGRSSDSDSDEEPSRGQFAGRAGRRRSSGTLGKLTMTPQPSAVEQARMDAWSADGDDFLVGDYDLTGANFELPCAPASLNACMGADRCAYAGVPLAAKSPSPEPGECATPASRLSSTSTFVEENALSPDQYKRIYSSSVRKLQYSPGRHGISCIVHIRSIMAKANERHVVVTGGRALDARPPPCDVFADFYSYATEPAIVRQPRFSAAPCPATSPVAYECPKVPLPVSFQSVGCIQPLAVCQSAAPLSSLAEAEQLYNSDLLGSDAGDLVSLDPIGEQYTKPCFEALDALPVYRPMRRRKADRRAAVRFRFALVAAT